MNWRDFLGFIHNRMLYGPLLQSRSDVMAKTGTTFGGNRKHYENFGWPVSLDYDYFKHMYDRGGIARRIVCAYPQATWRMAPNVKDESEGDETQFDKAWKELVNARSVFHYLERVDRLARLGAFAILFLGYSDAKDQTQLAQPVGALSGTNPSDKLLYLQPYGQDKVQVNIWEEDPSSPRYGYPKIYTMQVTTPSLGGQALRASNASVQVHWTRVLHVAEDVLESDIEGTSCLESVMNYLLDLEKVHGSAAEAFYQQSPPLTMFSADKDANIDTDAFSDSDLEEQVENFVNGYKRWLAVQGMTATSLSPQFGDPSAIKEALLELIAGTTGIPKRILVGSERGELASTQDETAWNARVEERQLNWAEPMVLRRFIDEMVAKGVLPLPTGGEYQVEWAQNQSVNEETQAKIAQFKSTALSQYVSAMGADEVVPPDIFLESILGLDPEVVDRIKETRQELWDLELESMITDASLEEVPEEDIAGDGQDAEGDEELPVE